MRHTDAVLLDGPKDNQMYQIHVDDTAMWVGTLEHPLNQNGWIGYTEHADACEALATALETFICHCDYGCAHYGQA